jgi:DNA-binding transcriptional MerR regulator
MNLATSPFLAAGDVARILGVPPWVIRRMFERGLLPEAPRFRTYRIFTEADVPRIRDALVRHGYLRDTAAAG